MTWVQDGRRPTPQRQDRQHSRRASSESKRAGQHLNGKQWITCANHRSAYDADRDLTGQYPRVRQIPSRNVLGPNAHETRARSGNRNLKRKNADRLSGSAGGNPDVTTCSPVKLTAVYQSSAAHPLQATCFHHQAVWSVTCSYWPSVADATRYAPTGRL
jgi:hypothetical protein